MPTCPGCDRSVPHAHLVVHERYCGGIWGDNPEPSRALEQLDARLAALERRMDRGLEDQSPDQEESTAEPSSEQRLPRRGPGT